MILISGSCVIESRDVVFRIAEALMPYQDDCTKDFYFKASFDKANRTSLESFRGPGMEEGLKIIVNIKKGQFLAPQAMKHSVALSDGPKQ